MLDRDGEVPALIEAAKLGVWGVGADGDRAALWDLDGLGGGEGLSERVAGTAGCIGVRCWWGSHFERSVIAERTPCSRRISKITDFWTFNLRTGDKIMGNL